MLLNLPAYLLYRRGVNLYGPMRVLCTNYRCLMRLAVFLGAATATTLLIQTGVLQVLGILVPAWPDW